MADKKMTLQLGGQNLVLNYGVNYFYKYFKEGTGMDLLTFSKTEIDSVSLIEFVAGLIYAGHMAESKISNTNHTLTKQQVDEYVWALSPEESGKIFEQYNNLMSEGKETGEPGGQTENL